MRGSSNTVWRITWGDYDFALDRQTLTYDLIETQTGTVWASGLSVGWMELENRATGERVQHDFAQAKLVSVAEKSSAQGKRLLLGLDLLGVPIDLYFICSQREIQLTVEANRDTREYLVQDVGLLPGLVSVPDDRASYVVFPEYNGRLIFAHEQEPKYALVNEIWNTLTMPFIGAVRCGEDVRDCRSALCLITDSAYGAFVLVRSKKGDLLADTRFERDPERRRLEIRVSLKPKGNHADIAYVYREKLIEEKNHVTLRRKIRDIPEIASTIESAMFPLFRLSDDSLRSELTYVHNELNVTNALFIADFRYLLDLGDERDDVVHAVANSILNYDYQFFAGTRIEHYEQVTDVPDVQGALLHTYFDGLNSSLWSDEGELEKVNDATRWEQMEYLTTRIKDVGARFRIVGTSSTMGDWCTSLVHFMDYMRVSEAKSTTPLPLWEVCHRDEVVQFKFTKSIHEFLYALISLSPPHFQTIVLPNKYSKDDSAYVERYYAVLSCLYRLTFSSFVVKHCFLTTDLLVQEATYSDKTNVIINLNSKAFEREDLHLPPGGFYVRHAQMEAHYALRVGEQVFETPAWRIRRARDGKRLEESEDVLYQEFPV